MKGPRRAAGLADGRNTWRIPERLMRQCATFLQCDSCHRKRPNPPHLLYYSAETAKNRRGFGLSKPPTIPPENSLSTPTHYSPPVGHPETCAESRKLHHSPTRWAAEYAGGFRRNPVLLPTFTSEPSWGGSITGLHGIPFAPSPRQEYTHLCREHASLEAYMALEGTVLEAGGQIDTLDELNSVEGAMIDQSNELHAQLSAAGIP